MKYSAFIVIAIFLGSCEGKKSVSDPEQPAGPKPLSFSILQTFPHDTSSYTQGLQVYKGALYEGTGNYGKSALKRVELSSGKSQQQIVLENRYFGEGITILHDTVYQLTWQEKKVFVYTLATFKKIREFDVNFDGWGLTNDGTNLIVSNGSGELFFYRPHDFSLIRTQVVTEAGSPSFNINELEYINGFIYANQYTYPYLLKIDPNNGVIVAKADLTEMWNRNRRIYPQADVPNGIAYDAEKQKIYVTGKWWPELYEIQFSN